MLAWVPGLEREEDYTVDEKHRTVALTPEGMNKLESILNVENLYEAANFGIVHFVEKRAQSSDHLPNEIGTTWSPMAKLSLWTSSRDAS